MAAVDSQFPIRRPRLLQALNTGLAGKLTLVVAPPGYGKSTVISQFLEEGNVSPIWCRFAPEDDSPTAFARKLLQAIADANGIGTVSEARPEAQLKAALSELSRSCPGYWVVVLEDFHYVGASEGVAELTGTLLEDLPPEIHVILASRTWPEVPQISDLLARQTATVIDAESLALTGQEVAEVVTALRGEPADDDEVSTLSRITRGWPACVVLLATHGTPFGIVKSAEASQVYAYLASQVLDVLPMRLARFMVDTSALPYLETRLCDELLRRSDAAARVAELRHRHLVEPSPDRPSRHQYHPLLREFLLARLRVHPSARYKLLHLRAANLLRRLERWTEAVQILSALEAWDELANMLEEVGPGLLKKGNWVVLSEWIDRVPTELLLRHEKLVLLRSKLAFLTGDAAGALQVLAGSPAALDSPHGLICRSAVFSLLGRAAEAARAARQAVQAARRAGDGEALASARLNLGIAKATRGQYVSAERELRAALRHFVNVGDVYGQALARMNLAGALHFRGRADEEAIALESAEKLWRKLGNHEHLVRTLNNLGLSRHRRGDYEGALRVYLDCIEVARRLQIKNTEMYASIGLADLFVERGMISRARALYFAALELSKDLEEDVAQVSALTGLAEAEQVDGDLDQALAIARQALARATEQKNAVGEGRCWTVLGAIYIHSGLPADGCEVLRKAIGILGAVDSPSDNAKAHLYLAIALYRLRKRSMALQALRTAEAYSQHLAYDGLLKTILGRETGLAEYAQRKGVGRWAIVQAKPGRAVDALPTVALRLLGNFEVTLDGKRVEDNAWETSKAKELLAYFVIRNRPLLKEEVVEALWPSLPADKCSSYFHATLHRVRRAIHPGSIIREGRRYVINRDLLVSSDASEFLRLLDEFREHHDPALLRRGLSLYGGSLTPEIYSDWAADERSRLDDAYTWALDRYLDHCLETDDREEIQPTCERILRIDLYNERAWLELVRHCRASGLQAMTFRVYRRCRDAFNRELQLDVPSQITALVLSA